MAIRRHPLLTSSPMATVGFCGTLASPERKIQNLIVNIWLSRDNPGDAARQLLALWRPAMPEVKVGAPLVATGERETEERRKPKPEMRRNLSSHCSG
jgi:hypothetical protein